MKKLLLILVTFALLNDANASNDTIPKTRSKYQLGFNVGTATGFGLSCRYTPPTQSKLMHQFTFLPFLNGDFYFVDAAYAAFYRIKEKKYTDFNIYGGTHFIFASEGTLNITGGGIGFDIQMSDLCLNLNTGYGLYTLNDKSGATPMKTNFMFYPTGEIGLFYKL